MAGREYGPTAGIKPLRAAVARLYNEHHRKGKSSQYSWENVAIVPGGRAGLIRIAAVLNVCILSDLLPSTRIFRFTKPLFFSFPVNEDSRSSSPLFCDISSPVSRAGPQMKIT